MRKEIKVDKDHKFEINTSFGWAYVYKEYFGEDILPEVVPLLESALGIAADFLDQTTISDVRDIISEIAGTLAGTELTTVTNVLWSMAKNADDDIPDVKEWFNGFERFPVDEILPQVVWTLAESTISTKKVKSLKDRMKNIQTEMKDSQSTK